MNKRKLGGIAIAIVVVIVSSQIAAATIEWQKGIAPDTVMYSTVLNSRGSIEIDGKETAYLVLTSSREASIAKAKCYCNMDFDEIKNLSFEYCRRAGGTTPYMIIEMDRDYDGKKDFWVIQEVSEAKPEYWQIYGRDSWRVDSEPVNYQPLSYWQKRINGNVLAIKVAVRGWDDKKHSFYVDSVKVDEVTLFETLLIYEKPEPVYKTIIRTAEAYSRGS